MNVAWNIKVNSKNKGEAQSVFDEFIKVSGLKCERLTINEYPKFKNMYECLFLTPIGIESEYDLECLKEICKKIGNPWLENGPEYYENGEVTYDAMIDSRKHKVSVPNLFWANCLVYPEINEKG